jgi:hypothetical protein
MDIVVDFDGTCVMHEFPKVGRDIGAVPVLKALVDKGHRLILFTMRSDIDKSEMQSGPSEHAEIHLAPGEYLTAAVKWFEANGIPLYGVQTNPRQGEWTKSPKAYGHLIIDDAALGIPLIHDMDKKPFVDWYQVHRMLIAHKILSLTGNILIDNEIMTGRFGK